MPHRLVLFLLVWPFLALLDALRNYRRPWAKNVVWLFSGFFGLVFVIAEGTTADSAKYAAYLEEMRGSDLSFPMLFGMFYAEGSRYLDIAQPLLTFLVSRFTDDHRVLFGLLGFIFGYFYSRNIWFLVDRIPGRIKPYTIFLLVSFALVVGMWQINGIRFWVATHIFLFGTLAFLLEKKTWGPWVAFSAIFFHFAFLFPAGIFLVYLMAGNRLTLYFVLFVLSVAFWEIDIGVFRDLHAYLPEILQDRTDSYLGEEYLEGRELRAESWNWYIRIHGQVMKWVILVFMGYFFLLKKSLIRHSKELLNLLSFALLYGTFVNLADTIPSMPRFMALSNMLFLAFVFIASQYFYDKHINLFSKLAIPFLMLYIIVRLRYWLDYAGIFLLIGNPVIAIITKDETNLITFIKMLL